MRQRSVRHGTGSANPGANTLAGNVPQMKTDRRPGLNPIRLVRLMEDALERCSLDLRDLTVLTEAATGPYAVTAVMAAMAGAHVYALAAPTVYATSEELERVATELAAFAGVGERLEVIVDKRPQAIAAADIITNSGQVRPIDKDLIAHMKPTAVIPLMYESWEFRGSDIDLQACRAREIPVAGTNERHPAVDVFSYLGAMAVKQMLDAGIAVYGSKLVVLCDNDFDRFIAQGLRGCGADVVETRELSVQCLGRDTDGVLAARRPADGYVVTAADASALARHAPGAVLVEFWGDTDREAMADAAVPVWPPTPAPRGHMAILPSAVGPEATVRLQAGGLKVGEVLARGVDRASPDDLRFVQML